MKDKTKLILVEVLGGLLALAAFLTVVSGIGGCSTMKQSAEFTDPNTNARVKLVNTKSSFCYWSKYQADVNTFGMTTYIYDAEGRPDPNSVKAVAEGVTSAILKGFKP